MGDTLQPLDSSATMTFFRNLDVHLKVLHVYVLQAGQTKLSGHSLGSVRDAFEAHDILLQSYREAATHTQRHTSQSTLILYPNAVLGMLGC